MISYVDSSVLLSRYLGQERANEASQMIRGSAFVATPRIAEIEVKRGLAFVDSPAERLMCQGLFADDWRGLSVVECDRGLAEVAATIAAHTRVRSLDAIHVASALVVGAGQFLTFDQRQAEAARAFDLKVVGVPI